MNNTNIISLEDIYESMLDYVVDNKFTGACHSTSATMYILLSELGLNPKLKIGEVFSYSKKVCFDHSWIEMDNHIFDVAIGYPQPPELGGQYVCGPIFNSIDLSTVQDSDVCFRYQTTEGLGEPALSVSRWTLQEYNDSEDTDIDIWDFTVLIGSRCKLDLNRCSLVEKYGSKQRELVIIE